MMRVLLVDDSDVTRAYLSFLLGQDPDLEVAGTAADGIQALEQVERLHPDVVLMDVNMPRMNGYEATREIMERVPVPIVMASAAADVNEQMMMFQALAAGAVTAVVKPSGLDHPAQEEQAAKLIETVKLMAEVKVVRRWGDPDGRASPVAPSERAGCRIRIVALGASTGGPAAVATILRGLPQNLPSAITYVQHITPGFIQGLVGWLSQVTPLRVRVARDGELLEPGTVSVAPDGLQMGVTPAGRIALVAGEGKSGFRPSISHMFRAVAGVYGPAAMGVLLTGMGCDGATGLRCIRDAGGTTVAQDEETSVIFGMPSEAVSLGAAEYVLPPAGIAAEIRARCGVGAGLNPTSGSPGFRMKRSRHW